MSGLFEICPRCEEAILTRVEVPHDLQVSGSVVRIPKVQMEECRKCGFRTLSGREVRLFDVLFAPQFADVRELIGALRTAGYAGMFLREEEAETSLAFGSRQYVETLASELRGLYLDNESNHVLDGLTTVTEGWLTVELATRRCTVRLPKIGEGENGVVFDYKESAGDVLKLAKPRQYSREHIVEEVEVTEFFTSHGVPVPAIVEADPYGSYVIKARLAGQSLAVIYDDLGPPEAPRHRAVRAAVERFAFKLIELFAAHPEAKTSISPNNIFVVEDGADVSCLLVDTGPAPFHDYSTFDFAEYWERVVPEKIKRYRAVGYI
jgi:hypothetical protein